MPVRPTPRGVVAPAVQNLVAARLGRGFVPLAVLFCVGIAERFGPSGEGTLVLPLGSVLAAGAMLLYGLRISQRAFARPPKAWMSLAMWGSLVPPLFAVYVLGWRGLRQLATGDGLTDFGVGIAFAVLGSWTMRSWMKVVEVERLSQVMTMDTEGGA